MDDPAWATAAVDWDESVASTAAPVYQVWVYQVWTVDTEVYCRQDDFPDGCNRADYPVRKADDCSPDGYTEDEAADNSADDSASRRHSPDG